MAFQRAVIVRSAALRRSALSLAKAISIGLKSGLYGGRWSSLDHLAHPRPLVAGQVVHDHNVADRQFRDQHLLDVGFEGVAVDWAVENEGSDEALERERADEDRRLPVAVRRAHAQAFALQASASPARHIGGGPGLVDEDQLFWLQIELAVEPVLATLQNVGAVLLGGVR